MWLVCACTPLWLPAPNPTVRPTLQPFPFSDRPTFFQDGGGATVLRGTDDYTVNTVKPPFYSALPEKTNFPPVTAVAYGNSLTPVPARHIGNLLDGAGRSWAYYGEGYATGADVS